MKYLRLIGLLALFLGTQYVTSLAVTLWLNAGRIANGQPLDYGLLANNPNAMGTALLAANAILIALLLAFRWIKRPNLTNIRLKTATTGWALLTTLAIVLATNQCIEWLSLPDWNRQTFSGLIGSLPCILAITLTGPLTEELVFRKAFITTLRRAGWHPLASALCSALVFGVIHLNPAQTAAAAIIGLFFGLLYLRHGLMLAVMAHIFNNTLGLISMTLATEKTSVTQPTLPVSIVFFALCTIVAVIGIHRIIIRDR